MSRAFVALFVVASASLAQAQSPFAGPDQEFAWPATFTLAGAVAGATPLEWFTADGNNATEDMLVRYTDAAGATAVGTLRTASGTVLGWPGDMVVIGGAWWGVDVGQRRIYTLDPTTAVATLIGSSAYAANWSSVNSLAYDATNDRLFGVDTGKKQLLRFNRATGQATAVGSGTLAGYPLVRALAYDASTDRLLCVDASTSRLVQLDPATGVASLVVAVQPDPTSRVEELEYYGAELFASRGALSGGVLSAGQLARLDPTTGTFENVGPQLASVSPHCLRVVSAPERVTWSQLSGPGVASFADAHALATDVTFSAAGVYALELSLAGGGGTLTDVVLVTADGCPNDPLEILPANCHTSGTSFCSGDGSAAACPCGNTGGAGEGCRNSTGHGALLANTGGVSVVLDDALLVATQLPPNKAALIFAGTQTLAQLAGKPAKDGLRCVAGQIVRFPVASSGVGGSIGAAAPIALAGGTFAVGNTWYFQCWYRDDASVCGKSLNYSNGLALTFLP